MNIDKIIGDLKYKKQYLPFILWAIALILSLYWYNHYSSAVGSSSWQLESDIQNCNQSLRDDDVNNYGQVQQDHMAECRTHIIQRARDTEGKATNFATWPPIIFLMACAAIQLGLRQRQMNATVLEGIAKPRWEIIVGDVYRDISGSVLIVRSKIETAIKVNEDKNPDLALAIAEIAKAINASGKREAIGPFEDLTSELSRKDVSKGVVRNSWNTLTKILPPLKDSAQIVEAITKIIG